MMRTIKEVLMLSYEFDSLEKLKLVLDMWDQDYNAHYIHSNLGYMPSIVFEQKG